MNLAVLALRVARGVGGQRYMHGGAVSRGFHSFSSTSFVVSTLGSLVGIYICHHRI